MIDNETLREHGIEPGKQTLYIASPCRGDVEGNMAVARGLAGYFARQGFTPLGSHLVLAGELDDENPRDREVAIEVGKHMVTLCDALFAFYPEGGVPSEGVTGEVQVAIAAGLEVRWYTFRTDHGTLSIKEREMVA